ncbi:MAG: hypothetical protein FJ090_18295 [Deltaproteobacteria bacterium]|nr:hypothetical protein [Deltaproteobacteria bacterium]
MRFLPLCLSVACWSGLEETTCDQLCEELVMTCEYAAFPDFSSCQKGCLYDEEHGANTDGMLRCVSEAECSTFDVLECEHRYEVRE